MASNGNQCIVCLAGLRTPTCSSVYHRTYAITALTCSSLVQLLDSGTLDRAITTTTTPSQRHSKGMCDPLAERILATRAANIQLHRCRHAGHAAGHIGALIIGAIIG
eukprot:scaffold132711_cov22-Tisochrysis_lutea.AAC.2